MDRYEQISLLHEAEQAFRLNVQCCEAEALEGGSPESQRVLKQRIEYWQNKAQQAEVWKQQLEQDSYQKEFAQSVATGFFYWWHNQPGTNTQQGFEQWWSEVKPS